MSELSIAAGDTSVPLLERTISEDLELTIQRFPDRGQRRLTLPALAGVGQMLHGGAVLGAAGRAGADDAFGAHGVQKRIRPPRRRRKLTMLR